ncbi:hypothetical protein E0H82_11120 [Acinetobacter sp. ANC 4910]|uniref:hypothetical protein n=1 Tax=Acinetobacter sp. ANC 4910 TaxID=2529850 RepID=UPI00103A59AF|nr:hypothetical protein [Acinetobacter sp. ANC 4910]TCB34236.1 hypothetical protein E0H82_11120 [Acinetobacter sp. ANC 4910]
MSNFIIVAKQSGIEVYYGTRHDKQTILGSLPEWLASLSDGDCLYTEKRAKSLVLLLQSHYQNSDQITDISIQEI